MMDSAPLPTRRARLHDGVHPAGRDPGPPAPFATGLWNEHGWSLSGTTVAALVIVILAASCAVQLLG